MSTTRYKIRLWEYDGEASVANAVTFDSFAEAEARFNDLRVSEEMPCVEFIKERIANGCIIGDEVLNVRQFASVFDAITKDKPTLAGFLRSLPVIEAPWDAAFQKRYCSSCTAEGAPYIVAKAGFLLQAVIMPYDVINQQFVERLQSLTRECEFSLSEKERREREARDRFTFTEPEQCSLNVDPDTGEVVEESEVADE